MILPYESSKGERCKVIPNKVATMGLLPGQISSTYGLARRGLDAFRGDETPTEEFQMPLWGTVMIASTLFVFMLMDFMVC